MWAVTELLTSRARDAGLMCTRTSKVIPAFAVGALLLLAGCGSSGPTKAQYTASANAICRSASAQSTPLIRQLATAAASLSSSAGQTQAQDFAGALERLHVVASDTLTKLRALKQPTAGHAQIERFLTPFTTVTNSLGEAAGAINAAQPREALADLERAAPASGQITSAARAYGMTRCENVLAALGNTGGLPPVHATLTGENHNPRVNQPWTYTVTVTDAHGNKLSGTETTQYTYSGAVVGTEQPTNVKFAGGVYHDTISFPARALGMPLDVQTKVHVSLGSVTLEWPIIVKR